MRLQLGLAVLIAATLMGVGCNKSQPTDAQVASSVQSKINADSAVPSKTVAVQAANGVVTLSGNVASDNERLAAANDAASIGGVKTVINNLEVGGATAASDQPAAPPPAVQTAETQPAPAPARAPTRAKREKPSARERHHRGQALSETDNTQQEVAQAQEPAPSYQGTGQPDATPAPAPVQNTPPPPPAPPARVTIPSGTTLSVRLVDGLDSEKNRVGDTFHATLNTPIVISDRVVIPRDADVQGHVVDVKSAGRFAGGSNLTIQLDSIAVNGRTYNIDTNQWARNGTGEGKKTATKAGGGALLGAIIGGIAGGGKGAAIGTLAGGAAGTGAAAATNKANQIKLAPEALLSFSLQNPITVTPQASNNRNADRGQVTNE